MTWMKYVTDPATGCCTTKELITVSREDPAIKATLKQWAEQEMRNKGVEFTESK